MPCCSRRISFPKNIYGLFAVSAHYQLSFKAAPLCGECVVVRDRLGLVSWSIHNFFLHIVGATAPPAMIESYYRIARRFFMVSTSLLYQIFMTAFRGAAESNRKQKICSLHFGKIAVSVRRRLHCNVLPPDAPHIARLSEPPVVFPTVRKGVAAHHSGDGEGSGTRTHTSLRATGTLAGCFLTN